MLRAAAICATALCCLAAAGNAADRTLNLEEGIYTFAQAARGEQAFATSCAACHGDDLAGRGPSPSLAGDSFVQRWQGRSVGEFYERMSTTMPKQQPHGLSDQTYADIVAFVLQANAFPWGNEELKPDQAALKKVVIGPR